MRDNMYESIKRIILFFYSPIIKFIRSFNYYLLNNIYSEVPCWSFRSFIYRLYGIHIGKGTRCDMKLFVMRGENLSIGNHTHINRNVMLDARGG